jgi:hypothetical protein
VLVGCGIVGPLGNAEVEDLGALASRRLQDPAPGCIVRLEVTVDDARPGRCRGNRLAASQSNTTDDNRVSGYKWMAWITAPTVSKSVHRQAFKARRIPQHYDDLEDPQLCLSCTGRLRRHTPMNRSTARYTGKGAR